MRLINFKIENFRNLRLAECTKHHYENYMTPEIQKVFDEEPYSNYCFDCGEFVPSQNHENALEKPERVYSHVVATGFKEHKEKPSEWVIKRITAK